MMYVNLSNYSILNIKSAYFGCIMSGINKSEAKNLMKIIDLTKKAEHYKI